MSYGWRKIKVIFIRAIWTQLWDQAWSTKEKIEENIKRIKEEGYDSVIVDYNGKCFRSTIHFFEKAKDIELKLYICINCNDDDIKFTILDAKSEGCDGIVLDFAREDEWKVKHFFSLKALKYLIKANYYNWKIKGKKLKIFCTTWFPLSSAIGVGQRPWEMRLFSTLMPMAYQAKFTKHSGEYKRYSLLAGKNIPIFCGWKADPKKEKWFAGQTKENLERQKKEFKEYSIFRVETIKELPSEKK